MAFVAVVGALAAAALLAPAAAQALSPGCTALNDAAHDAFYFSGSEPSLMFAQGEQLSMTAAAPNDNAPTQVELRLNNALVKTAAFPGTAAYTIPSGGFYTVNWTVTPPADVTWTVSCVAPQPLSPGCAALNNPAEDGFYESAGLNPPSQLFAAGEHASMTAAAPTSAVPPTQVALTVNNVVVDTAVFPGTVEYTFPAAGSYVLMWQALLPGANVTWTVSCGTAVAARFRGLSVTTSKRGVLVRWRTASELDVLGFSVYRGLDGRRVRVNKQLIAARNRASGASYSYLDRSARKGTRYWIQAVNVDGSRSWFGPARVARP